MSDKYIYDGTTAYNRIANINNPYPILQQPKSGITTNPLIPNEHKAFDVTVPDKTQNNVMDKRSTQSIRNITLKEITTGISSSFIGFCDDMFQKPDEDDWYSYIVFIVSKENRYAYMGVLLILFAFFVNLAMM